MHPVKAIHMGLIVLSGFVLVYRFRSLRRNPGSPAARALFLTVLMFQISFVLGDPASYWFLHRLTGQLPGIPQLFQHMAGMAMAYYAEVLIIWVIIPPEDRLARARALRTQRWMLAVAFGVLLICYALGPLRLGIPILDPHGYQDWGITAYIVAWQAYVAIALGDMLRLRRRHSAARRPYLRLGLNLLTVGYFFIVAEILHKIGYQVAANLGARLPWEESGPQGVQIYLALPIVICYAVGLTIPSWGPRADLRWRRWRAYHQITPLVAALRAVVPDQVPVTTRGLRDRLQQQTVFVRDAMLGPLRDHLNPQAYDLARQQSLATGASEPQARAVAEAAYLAAAVRAKVAGSSAVSSREPRPLLSTGATLDDEATWLAQVSQAFVSSPVVQEVLATS